MRQTGELVMWDDGRGFGFIRIANEPNELFVHAKAVRQSYTRLRVGDHVSFKVGKGRNGKLAAHDVDIAGANPRPRSASRRGMTIEKPPPRLLTARISVATAIVGLLLANLALDRFPLWVAALYALAGFISLLLYRVDKLAAQEHDPRTPEDILHAADLGCGIVGGLLAQELFRHKTIKPRFVRVTWTIAAAHAALLGYLLVAPQAISISHQWL